MLRVRDFIFSLLGTVVMISSVYWMWLFIVFLPVMLLLSFPLMAIVFLRWGTIRNSELLLLTDKNIARERIVLELVNQDQRGISSDYIDKLRAKKIAQKAVRDFTLSQLDVINLNLIPTPVLYIGLRKQRSLGLIASSQAYEWRRSDWERRAAYSGPL